MKLNSLEELFVCLLSDIYLVEKQIIRDMPKLIQKAESKELQETLKTHLTETKEQLKRLDRVFHNIKQTPSAIIWSGDIKNLFADAETFLLENQTSPVLDAAIIAISQRIEHFEIATYGTLREFADVLEYDEVKSILEETLKEEAHADKLLSKLAEGGMLTRGINVKAAQ